MIKKICIREIQVGRGGCVIHFSMSVGHYRYIFVVVLVNFVLGCMLMWLQMNMDVDVWVVVDE